ncbi:MAG TPA: heterodisulfide reductase-related iron-sulfur binding cluster, partial [Anaerolineae bacterium]|nr:heterodisulfide reductase-related iron-sulfur binding cluster [Anaerolineae bacterium]
MKYAYYPGCSLHASAKEYDLSWKAVCERLGIELLEMADWSCCGTVHATSVDRTLSLALAARNLTIAEAMDLEIVAPCSGC